MNDRAIQVSGRVIDAATKRGIGGVRVGIAEHPKTFTQSDSSGAFTTRPDRYVAPVILAIPGLHGHRVYQQYLVAEHPIYRRAAQKLWFQPHILQGEIRRLDAPIALEPR